MTIRDELKLLGPEAVRAGMIAFQHRGDLPHEKARGSCPTWGAEQGLPCCFLRHAGNPGKMRERLASDFGNPPIVEVAFENWETIQPNINREELHKECIAFLAEHGNAPEIAPLSRDTEVVESVR